MVSMPSDKDNLNPSGITLPAYVLLRPEGVFIKMSPPPAQDILQAFVDRLFSNETRFAGLDYACFLRLLYGDPAEPISGGEPEVRIASGIVRFPPERMALYKSVNIIANSERAEYMFEPAIIEVEKDEPVYGEPDEDGIKPIIDHIHSIEKQAAQLDFDEFVASMWVKGVRFGIDVKAVCDALQNEATARIDIALQLEPTESKDAEIVEETDLLHQDKSLMILADGKADLHRVKNRFPQVGKNVVLLRKIPRVLGKPGHRVNGTVIEPRIPEDVDLVRLAGAGTRIEQSPKGEILVSSIDGFIVFDEGTGGISITTKIENQGGISAKSTGDIKLTVEEYIEHGEVEEGCVVEGKHLVFLADVFGTVISDGGNIELNSRLSGGHAKSVGGNIGVKGKTLNATLEAWDGNVRVEFVENSLIMGKSVIVGRAVNCEIVAEELQLGVAEGCAIAGKNLQIVSTSVHKNRETVISILLPDIAGYDRQIAEARNSIVQIEQAIQAKNREIALHQSDPRFARYIEMAEKVRAGEIKFTPEQQAGWQKIVNQFAPIERGTESLRNKRTALEQAIEKWSQERATCGAGEYCKIDQVLGDTVVRKLHSNLGMSALRDVPAHELRIQLQQLGEEHDRIFWDNKGALDWHFTIPEMSPAPQTE